MLLPINSCKIRHLADKKNEEFCKKYLVEHYKTIDKVYKCRQYFKGKMINFFHTTVAVFFTVTLSD